MTKHIDEIIGAVRSGIMQVGECGTYEALLADAAEKALLPHLQRLVVRLEKIEDILNRLNALIDFTEPLCGDAMVFNDAEAINNVMSDAAAALSEQDERAALYIDVLRGGAATYISVLRDD